MDSPALIQTLITTLAVGLLTGILVSRRKRAPAVLDDGSALLTCTGVYRVMGVIGLLIAVLVFCVGVATGVYEREPRQIRGWLGVVSGAALLGGYLYNESRRMFVLDAVGVAHLSPWRRDQSIDWPDVTSVTSSLTKDVIIAGSAGKKIRIPGSGIVGLDALHGYLIAAFGDLPNGEVLEGFPLEPDWILTVDRVHGVEVHKRQRGLWRFVPLAILLLVMVSIVTWIVWAAIRGRMSP